MTRRRYKGLLSADDRRRLWQAQEGRCPLCGWRLFLDVRTFAEPGQTPTVDHVHPRANRGPNRLGNYLLVHERCNVRKGNRRPRPCELIWLAAVVARLNAPLRVGGAPGRVALANPTP